MRYLGPYGLRGICLGEALNPGPSHAAQDLRLRHHLPGQTARKTRDIKRGASAWIRAASAEAGDHHRSVERLLVHSVSDDTALNIYLPDVRKFLVWADANNIPICSFEDKGSALAQYLSFRCYQEDVGPASGDAVLNGFVYLFPELRSNLPRAWPCLLAWHRVHIHGEGAPEALKTLACVADEMRRAKCHDEAAAPDLAVDCYLRSMDFLNLCAEDVIVLEGSHVTEVTLRLGVAD